MSGWWQWLLGLSSDDFAGVADWSLRLLGVPGNVFLLLALVGGFALLVWLTLRNYGREGRTPQRVKLTLAGIRIAVLVLLMLVVLQPAIVLEHRSTSYSTVIVLVDDTLSMRWRDVYTDASERTQLASYLKLEHGALEREDRPTRMQLIREALGTHSDALRKLSRHHPIEVIRFGRQTTENAAYIETIAHVKQSANGDDSAPEEATGSAEVQRVLREALAEADAAGVHTNLSRALREALERHEGRRIAAVVVLSDGQNTSMTHEQARMDAAASLARRRGVPVYAVAVGDPSPPRNVALASLQGPSEVRKGSNAVFTAVVTHRLLGGSKVQVKLERAALGSDEWESAAEAESLVLAGAGEGQDGPLQEVTLATEATQVGDFVYRATVEPLPGEMVEADNTASTNVRVSDKKVKVLLVSGDGGWEFQFLRNYMLKHPEHFDVTAWQQNADPRFNQDASQGMKRSALPVTRSELYEYDVVLLYDPRFVPDSLDDSVISLLKDFVSQHHGGLCYIPGNRFTDKNLLAGGPFSDLAGLLPVVLAPNDELPDDEAPAARQLQTTEAGLDHPIMQLGPSREATAEAWSLTPGVYRTHRVDKAKTLATVLAESDDQTRLTREGTRQPIIAIQYYGKGRVLYLGTDETWRWRAVDETRQYQRFWGQVLDFLAAGRLEKKRILITTGAEAFEVGTKIRARVEAYDRDFTPMTGDTFTVTFRSLDGVHESDHELKSTRPGVFEGSILAERVGMYELAPKAGPDGRADWLEDDVSLRRLDIKLPREELRRPEANHVNLRAIAGDPDRFLKLYEIDRLATVIPEDKLVTVTQVPLPIWNTFLMLILIGVLLLVEWTLRKASNLM